MTEVNPLPSHGKVAGGCHVVVLPTYDETDNVPTLIPVILKASSSLRIVVVDDASPDGTAAIVKTLARTDDRIEVIERTGKLGLGTAYAAGMRWALNHGATAVVTMDADFSHDPNEIPGLLRGLENHDLMIGSRYVPGGQIENWGLFRRFLSASANWLTRWVIGVAVQDCTSGFRAYRSEALTKIAPEGLRSHGYSYLEEMIYRCVQLELKIGEHPICFANRRAGQSKISKVEIFKGAQTLCRLAWRRFIAHDNS